MKYIVWVLFPLIVTAIYFVMRQRLPLKLERFAGRENLALERIHQLFYPGYDVTTFTELWTEIASNTEVPAGLIRPSDRFNTELGPVKGFPIAGEMEDLEEAFKRRCNAQSLDWHKVKVETVDDYIKQFGVLQRTT